MYKTIWKIHVQSILFSIELPLLGISFPRPSDTLKGGFLSKTYSNKILWAPHTGLSCCCWYFSRYLIIIETSAVCYWSEGVILISAWCDLLLIKQVRQKHWDVREIQGRWLLIWCHDSALTSWLRWITISVSFAPALPPAVLVSAIQSEPLSSPVLCLLNRSVCSDSLLDCCLLFSETLQPASCPDCLVIDLCLPLVAQSTPTWPCTVSLSVFLVIIWVLDLDSVIGLCMELNIWTGLWMKGERLWCVVHMLVLVQTVLLCLPLTCLSCSRGPCSRCWTTGCWHFVCSPDAATLSTLTYTHLQSHQQSVCHISCCLSTHTPLWRPSLT